VRLAAPAARVSSPIRPLIAARKPGDRLGPVQSCADLNRLILSGQPKETYPVKREHFALAIFFAIAVGIFWLTYRLVAPFLVPICWAAVFAILFYPLYRRLAKRVKRDSLASMLMVLLILVLIIGPMTYLGLALVDESVNAIARVNDLYSSANPKALVPIEVPWLETIKLKLSPYFDVSKINANDVIKQTIDNIGGLIVNKTASFVGNVTKAVLLFLMMLFTTYYFFKNGPAIVHKIKRLVPLGHDKTDLFFNKLRDVIYATMYSGAVIALLQGLIGGFFFWWIGISSALFWGSIMAFLSILPFVGAFIVYAPAGLYYIFTGSVGKGVLVLVVGAVIPSLIEHILRPYLVSGKSSMHPLVLFFSMTGGMALFGLVGLVVGPLLAAAFLTLLDVFEQKLNGHEIEADAA
jgi:predicted PurR-regulated permease PerM